MGLCKACTCFGLRNNLDKTLHTPLQWTDVYITFVTAAACSYVNTNDNSLPNVCNKWPSLAS